MVHLNLFLYLLSIVAAAASVTGAVVLYLHYRNKALLHYGLMLGVAALLLLHRMIEQYCGAMHIQYAAIPWLLETIEKAAYATGVFAGPFFMHSLLGLDLSARRKRTYLIIASVYTLSAAAEVAATGLRAEKVIHVWLSLPLLYGTFVYCLLVSALAIKKLGSPLLKTVVFSLFFVSLAILPFSFIQYFSQTPYLPGFMERPLLFIALFVLTLFFSIHYFNHPAYLENRILTNYFKERFSITDREGEIIAQVLQGHSNQTIGDKLFISVRTVESHLYNIFQKLGVKNRVQLVNLLQTNQSDKR